MNINTARITLDDVHAPIPQLIVAMQINGHMLSIDIRGEELAKLLSTSPRFFGITAHVAFTGGHRMNTIRLTPPEKLEAELRLDDARRTEAYMRAFEHLRARVYEELCAQDWRP